MRPEGEATIRITLLQRFKMKQKNHSSGFFWVAIL